MCAQFEYILDELLNEKLQRKRIKVMERRFEQNRYDNALRSGAVSLSTCDKIRALKNVLSLIK